MKTKSIAVISALLALTACGGDKDSGQNAFNSQVRFNGKNVTQSFVSQYQGQFKESEFGENYQISSDGQIVATRYRQVGDEKSKTVPYPTVCGYISSGKILAVEERTLDDRKRYIDYATHVIYVEYTDIRLTDALDRQGEEATSTNPHCRNFLAEERQYIARYGSLRYDLYAELLSSTSFRLNTSGGGDYKNGGPRTESTLDEVFTKTQN